MKDCSEIFRMDLKLPGVYALDFSGLKDVATTTEVVCDDSWMKVLVRDQFENTTVSVFNIFPKEIPTHLRSNFLCFLQDCPELLLGLVQRGFWISSLRILHRK